MKKPFFLAILSSVFLINVFLYLAVDINQNFFLLDFFYNLSPLVAVLAGMALVKQFGFRTARGFSFALITIGLSCWLAGDIIWAILEHSFDIDAFPSIVDVIYLLSYPLLIIGFYREYRIDKAEIPLKKAAIAIFISAVIIIFSLYYRVYLPLGLENTIWEFLFGIFYGLADTIISIILVMIFIKALTYRQGKFFLPWLYIFYGFLLNVLANTVYMIYFEVYTEGGNLYVFLDLLWIASYLFIALGLGSIFFVIKGIQSNLKKQLAGK